MLLNKLAITKIIKITIEIYKTSKVKIQFSGKIWWKCLTCVSNKGPQRSEYVSCVGHALAFRVDFHTLLSFTIITCESAATTDTSQEVETNSWSQI